MYYLGWGSASGDDLFYIGWLGDTGDGPGAGDDNYYNKLGGLGYEGSLATRQMNYLGDLGYTGAVSTRKVAHLLNLGYTRGPLSQMLKQKADAENYVSVSEMMIKTGYIPV